MNLIEDVQPISYLKTNTADVARRVNTVREPMMITVNGVIQMVIQDKHSYQQQIDTIALLKILAIEQKQIEQGDVIPATEVLAARKHQP